jgi:hypothetical protein
LSRKNQEYLQLEKKYGGTHISSVLPLYDIQRYTQLRYGLSEEKDRQFLQYLGAEWGRNKDPNICISLALKESFRDGNFFLSDFPNEFKNEGSSYDKLVQPFNLSELHRSLEDFYIKLDRLVDNIMCNTNYH